VLLKKAAGVQKGSANAPREKVGKVTRSQIREIAELKMKDLNAIDIEGAMRQIEGTAQNSEFLVRVSSGKQGRPPGPRRSTYGKTR
jgi:large subunit ribosomal protein L11